MMFSAKSHRGRAAPSFRWPTDHEDVIRCGWAVDMWLAVWDALVQTFALNDPSEPGGGVHILTYSNLCEA